MHLVCGCVCVDARETTYVELTVTSTYKLLVTLLVDKLPCLATTYRWSCAVSLSLHQTEPSSVLLNTCQAKQLHSFTVQTTLSFLQCIRWSVFLHSHTHTHTHTHVYTHTHTHTRTCTYTHTHTPQLPKVIVLEMSTG